MSLGTDQSWRGISSDPQQEQDSAPGLRGPSKRLLWSLLRPYRWWLLFLIVVVVAEAVARLAVPALVRRVIDSGLTDETVLLPSLGLMLLAITVQIVARITFVRRSGFIGNQILLELRRRLFTKFQRLSIAFHDRYTSGRAVSRLTSDTEAVQELVLQGLDVVVAALLTITGVSIVMLLLDWRLALFAFLTYPVLWWAMATFARASSKGFRTVRTKSALVIVQFIETMTGIKAVQSFRREERSREIFSEVVDDYRDANLGVLRVFSIAMPGFDFIGSLGIALVVLGGGYLALDGQVSVGTLAAFVLYLRMFFDPMQDLGQFISSLQSALTALEKVADILDCDEELPQPSQDLVPAKGAGQVTFHDVVFSYVPEKAVLPGLNLDIPAGQSVALVGTTGAGKTTIAKLIARFYDPQAGSITLDGVDLRDMSDQSLRDQVVLLTQENFMFDGTIADNIEFGSPGASRADIERAAQAVGAHHFIEKLPEGYDTDTGKRGSRLSAGQRQLVAFARAVLADPKVIILDEATSSLDIPTERLVQAALVTILAGRTAIIIAHRLSTVEIADRVLVLQHGRVVEDGSPQELIAAEGRYAELHTAWRQSLA